MEHRWFLLIPVPAICLCYRFLGHGFYLDAFKMALSLDTLRSTFSASCDSIVNMGSTCRSERGLEPF